MRTRTAASRFALPVFTALLLVLGAACADARVNAPNAPGAVHLQPGAFKHVGKTIVCGRVDGRWQPGTRRLSFWFFTHAQRAKNLTATARRSHGAARTRALRQAAAYRRRAKVEAPACGPLRFRVRGTVAFAVHGTVRPRAGHLSNLESITARGKVREAITSGSANVSRIYQAPNGKVYVLFTQSTQIGGGEPTGTQICDDSGDAETRGTDPIDDGSDPIDDGSDPTNDGTDTTNDGTDTSDPSCEPELTPVVYCVLAELDAAGAPTCVDTSLYSVSLLGPRGHNDPIQFDDSGAIYYASGGYSTGVLRRYLDGKVTSYISDPNVLIDNYLALGDGDVLLTGATVSTGSRWVRRIDLDGHVHSVRSVSANYMRLFGDGNAYMGFSAGADVGVRRFVPSTNTLESKYWLAPRGDREHGTEEICDGADQYVTETFCAWAGTRITDAFTTSDHRVFVIAGTADGGRLIQYSPDLRVPPTGVVRTSVSAAVGDDIAMAGVDAGEHRVLVLHDTKTDEETTLLGPDAEFDVYHLSYDEKNDKLLFDGLRFSDNTFVLGEVDLKTNAVTFPAASTTRWTDVTAVR
jgi:hypothetical protein